MQEIVHDIKELRLDILDNAWVEAIYFSEFLEFGEIPPEYEAISHKIKIKHVLQSIINSVGTWVHSIRGADEEKSWAILSGKIPYRKVLAIMGYHIHQANKDVMNEEMRNVAVLASRVYYRLLAIPGFTAYNIYHSQLFANSLSCLGFIKIVSEISDQRKNKEDMSDMVVQVNALVQHLQLYIADLKITMQKLNLGLNDMNYNDIVNNLVDVTGGGYINKLDIDKIELSRLSLVIYEVIEVLLSDANHQHIPEAILILFKCLHGKFVTACLDTKTTDFDVRASYVAYCGLLLSIYGKTAVSSFHILLEHLCYSLDGLERADVRMSRVRMLGGLISLLPEKIHERLLKWVITLSKSAKVLHRQLAVDVLDQMLNCDNRTILNPRYNFIKGSHGFCMETAVAIINGVPYEEAQRLYRSAPALENQADTENLPVAVSDDDLRGILQHHTIPLPVGQILLALYQRAQDVSGTVRARAISSLTRCLDEKSATMKDALRELHGGGEVSRLMALAARCVCDERAAVRRSGATLVHRLLATQDLPPAAVDLGILVSLCRDASILVRTGAITALADLVLKSPSVAVFDAFLQGPVHQLSDPEKKIQDIVKNMFQRLLIDRIKKYSAGHEDPIPWMLLGGITRHNMRRHLQKACAMLAQTTNCINVRLVDCLSTHLGALGAARDVQALVLLTGAARHVAYSDVTFVVQYYYQLSETCQTGECDPRLTPLTLELLSVWSRYLPDDDREMLRCHIVRRLAAPEDDGCRIATVSLAAQLDMNNLHWASQLMQLAENAALNGGDVEEWVRAADLSLVAPEPPSPDLLQLFLDAMVKLPTAGWSGRRAGACVAGAGRLCVRSRAAADAVAPRAAALLRADAPLPARVNALLVLSDICTRYTNIVEPLMADVCSCLDAAAPAPLRRHAARALTRLLLAGYLRLRTPLYFKYCALLADEDHDVREPAEYFVTCTLTADTIFHHFVDCVQYFNTEAFDNLSFDARQLIYDVMLQRLSLVQRLNTQCRLARELLEHAADVVDEGEELSQSMNHALLDTITVLCGPRMRLPKKQAPVNIDEIPDIDEIQERVTTNIVSSKMKHTVAEVVVPAVLRLHARLRASGGQLLAYLVRLATDLLNDYRQEIEELIETELELVEQIQQFQQTIGLEPANGNARNLVTSSAPAEPETPRAPRRRRAAAREPPRKRALDM